jgi:hypothetical protein
MYVYVYVCVCVYVRVRVRVRVYGGEKANGKRKKMEKREDAAVIGTWSWSWGALTHPMPWMETGCWDMSKCLPGATLTGYRGPLAYEHVHIYAMHHHHCYAVHSCTNGTRACKGIGTALLLYCVLPWYDLGTPVVVCLPCFVLLSFFIL